MRRMNTLSVLAAGVLCVTPYCVLSAESGDSAAVAGLVMHANRQRSFGSSIPPGDYSGIAWLGGDRYAVVSDKSEEEGFFLFDISIDSLTGRIRGVTNEGFVSARTPNRDHEGIVYVPGRGTMFICGEKDNRVVEFATNGMSTGRELAVPEEMLGATANYGLESLAYSDATGKFWTTTESTLPIDGTQAGYGNAVRNRLRIVRFGDDLKPEAMFFYEMDTPTVRKRPGAYAMGVSELCALDDGRLLVLEREFYVSRRKFGSYVNIKLYVVAPDDALRGEVMPKTLALQFKTRLGLFRYSLANYEGMCLGPRLADGSRVLIMVSDSQNRYGGVLKDYFKTVVIR